MAYTVETPFATADELREWWPDLPPGADAHANKLLLGASQFLVDLDEDVVDRTSPATLERIVCSMVRRSMGTSATDAGYSQVMQTAGSYSFQGQVSNPHGDFYLTKQEKKTLGIGGQRAFEVDMIPDWREESWHKQ